MELTSSKYFGRLKTTQKTMVGIMYCMTRLQGWLAAATTAKWYSTGFVTARYLSTACRQFHKTLFSASLKL
jgi:hypothetical protein